MNVWITIFVYRTSPPLYYVCVCVCVCVCVSKKITNFIFVINDTLVWITFFLFSLQR